jgi:hypothetical protein
LTDRQKRKTKKPTLRIFENFFCRHTFGTFAFARFLFFSGMGKGKRAKFSHPQDSNPIIKAYFSDNILI